MSEAQKPEWWFYHLQRTTLERAVGPLLEKCLERGWRVLAVSPDTTRRAALDEALAYEGLAVVNVVIAADAGRKPQQHHWHG